MFHLTGKLGQKFIYLFYVLVGIGIKTAAN